MDDSLVVAIDQGTTSARAVVFSSFTLPVAAYQFELTQITPNPGWIEQDPKQLVEACRTCLLNVGHQLAEKNIPASRVKAIGIANQRETSVLWDRRTGEPVANAIVWSDTRTEPLVEEMRKLPGADQVQEICGLHLNAYFAALKVRWLLDHNENARRVYNEGELCFGTVDSWLIYALSGGKTHITDASNASRSMLLNLKEMRYDDRLIQFFGFEKLILPEIRPSSEVYGHYHAPGEELHGIPISGCVGDQSSALIGHMGFNKGDAKNTYGTGCFLHYNTGETPVFSKNGLLTTIAYQLPGQLPTYALEGSVAVCGSAIKWLKNNLGMIETSEQVGDLIESVPNSAGVYFVTAFSGLFSPYWRADARGTIVGITSYTNRAHIVRSAIEAVCFQTRAIFQLMEYENEMQGGISNMTRDRILSVDGGLTSSDVIMQLQADILGVNIVRPAMKEVTALGAAIMAGLAVGVWKDLADVTMRHSLSEGSLSRFTPNSSAEQRRQGFHQWQRAVERATGWVESTDTAVA